MGETTDKIEGRTKQAAGSLTGDQDLKNEGQATETKGDIKGKLNDAVDGAKDALDSIKDKVS